MKYGNRPAHNTMRPMVLGLQVKPLAIGMCSLKVPHCSMYLTGTKAKSDARLLVNSRHQVVSLTPTRKGSKAFVLGSRIRSSYVFRCALVRLHRQVTDAAGLLSLEGWHPVKAAQISSCELMQEPRLPSMKTCAFAVRR